MIVVSRAVLAGMVFVPIDLFTDYLYYEDPDAICRIQQDRFFEGPTAIFVSRTFYDFFGLQACYFASGIYLENESLKSGKFMRVESYILIIFSV